MCIVNLSAYKFIRLERLPTLRAQLEKTCQRGYLRGTILLSHEGINMNLAGNREAIDSFKHEMQSDPRFKSLSFKESISEKFPFERLKVKVKKEVITMGVGDIKPEQCTAKHLPAKQFKSWLDTSKEMMILDTRNRYEIEHGTFDKAVDLGIDNFREFPQALAQFMRDKKDQLMVLFCTGGIRCEKASALLLKQGHKNVYQLDGGILKYFEECGRAHYRGNCFVFDERIAVDSQLQELIE